jgi:hypothetical protein
LLVAINTVALLLEVAALFGCLVLGFSFVFVVLSLTHVRQALYHLNHMPSPFCVCVLVLVLR